jgi:putative nucleotidyltransferase with HDIG domain
MDRLKNLLQDNKKQSVVISFFIILFSVLTYFLLLNNVKPVQYDLDLLSISNKTIYSPITIEDKAATAKKRQEASDRVKDQYVYREDYNQNRIDIVNSIFDVVVEVQQNTATKSKNKGQALLNEQVKSVKAKLPEDIIDNLSDDVFAALLKASPQELNIARASLTTSINRVMSDQIRTDQVKQAKKELANELSYVSLNSTLKKAMITIGQFAIVPNYFYDAEATKERKRIESEQVNPVYILQGQVLVKEGETITKEKYDQLQLVGLLNKNQTYQPYIGLLLLIGLFAYFIYKQLHMLEKKELLYSVAYFSILIFTLLIIKGISLFQSVQFTGLEYITPVAIGTLLIKFLFGNRYIIVSSLIFSICGSIMFNQGVNGSLNYGVGVYILMSAIAVLFSNKERDKRSMVMHSGMLISLVNVATILILLLLRNGQYSSVEIGINLLMGLGSGILSSIITMGVLPFIEDSFGMISPFKLMELGSPNHPLLRKILLETPGTYHHSIMVANLAEAACEAVGANGLLARVGSYYHDIGKTVNPGYFIENQMNGRNPHDFITPEKSRDIIFAHVSDGVKILQKYKMPNDIIDIAAEHHGTTLLKYFYYKEKEKNPTISEKEFRYSGPKAHSKETAIVGVADSVEAAVRSLKQPDMEKIEELVSAIINDRLQDGQFALCDLTFKELSLIEQSLCETLKGTFHSRIQYPNQEK